MYVCATRAPRATQFLSVYGCVGCIYLLASRCMSAYRVSELLSVWVFVDRIHRIAFGQRDQSRIAVISAKSIFMQ